MLKLISPLSDVYRKDYEIDTTYLTTNPTSSDATKMIIEAGRWVQLTTSGKITHIGNQAANAGTAGVGGVSTSTGDGSTSEVVVQLWNDKGDYGVQALGKATTLFLGSYEATTDMYVATSAGGSKAMAIGALLTVDEQGKLVVADTAGEMIVGQCTKLDSTAGTINFVRFASPYPLQ